MVIYDTFGQKYSLSAIFTNLLLWLEKDHFAGLELRSPRSCLVFIFRRHKNISCTTRSKSKMFKVLRSGCENVKTHVKTQNLENSWTCTFFPFKYEHFWYLFCNFGILKNL